jgi:hypothetical protein
MLEILASFPDHLTYLTRVATQRLETSYSHEVDLSVDIAKQFPGLNNVKPSVMLKSRRSFT